MSGYRIFLVDDHQILRDGLRSLIGSITGASVIGEADDGLAAIEVARHLRPDLIIMDIGMPHLNGIDATRKIKKQVPDTHILALSMHADRQFVNEALSAGAAGYLLKDCAFEELESAINTIFTGQVYLSPRLRNYELDQADAGASTGKSALSLLSPREREVLQLMVEGTSTTGIADKLHISSKTVESHRKRLMEKLNIFNIAELTKYAIREGLTNI